MVELLNVKATLRRVRGQKRLDANLVAEAMRTLFVGTRWELVASTIRVEGGTRVDTVMIVQHIDRTPVDRASLAAFATAFGEWVGHMGFDLSEWEATISEVVQESDTVPMYGGRFGREGLSD